MNHLAHAWLAAPGDDVIFGSLVADFLRGAIDPILPREVRIGIALHRAVDRYTDAHADVVAARRLFDPPLRRYAGIVLDVWFDHLLARAWAAHADGSLDAFSRQVQALLLDRDARSPPRLRAFVRYMRARDLPAAYRDRSVVADVFAGLSSRLRRANPLANALDAIAPRAALIEARFDHFFPDLVAFAGEERLRLTRTIASTEPIRDADSA